MFTRIEIRKLFDTVQDIANEFLQVKPGGKSHLPAQGADHCKSERFQVCVISKASNAVLGRRSLRDQITHFSPDFNQSVNIKITQPHLDRSRIVEAVFWAKFHVKALGQRRQSLNALRSVKECRGPGYQQIEPLKSPPIHFVNELPKCVQTFFTNVTADPLERFNLVEHYEQTRVSSIAKHD